MIGALDIAEVATEALSSASGEREAEHAVYGLDALDEVDLHAILAAGFERAGFGVLREVHFPGPKGSRAKDSERERCDLVVTRNPCAGVADPVKRRKSADRAAGTLFAPIAEAIEEEAAAGLVRPEEALWLEAKTLGQFAYADGVPGANRSYSSELLACARDLKKLAADRAIVHGALLVVLFAECEEVARHDLMVLAHRCLDKDLPIGSPAIEGFAVPDRIGNGWCAAGVYPLSVRADRFG